MTPRCWSCGVRVRPAVKLVRPFNRAKATPMCLPCANVASLTSRVILEIAPLATDRERLELRP